MSDFIRFDINPSRDATPQGKIDLFYDQATQGISSRTSSGIKPVNAAASSVILAPTGYTIPTPSDTPAAGTKREIHITSTGGGTLSLGQGIVTPSGWTSPFPVTMTTGWKGIVQLTYAFGHWNITGLEHNFNS